MKQEIEKYVELTKPKVTLLNLLVGITCFILAAFPVIDWVKLTAFMATGYLAAGGCGVMNSVYDKDIDQLMERTSKRAIPMGHVTPDKASILGIGMISISLTTAYLFINLLTFLMISLGIIFYLFVYTYWLKRTSPWNVVIGGFAGCFAAFSGWTAAVNTLGLMPLLIAMLDFVWTPGHLWGLAIKKIREYKSVEIPMLPVKIGLVKASKIVFLMNLLTVISSLILPLLHMAGNIYIFTAVSLGAAFLFQNRKLVFSSSETEGFKVFLFSMPYLLFLMIGLIADKIWLV